jgi:hypothetical protein
VIDPFRRLTQLWIALLVLACGTPAVAQQEQPQEVDLVERPGPPPLDPLEVDNNGDGVPDGWYNLRDCKWVEGGVGGPKSKCFRFENPLPGRPARASRAFGLDGRKTEAIIVGLWVRCERIGPGERIGDDPGLLIDLLGDQLKTLRRGTLGPWSKSVGREWTRVVKRISIPPGTRDAILSTGLLGATGLLEVDDLSIELVPVGQSPSASIITNGDFELGDPAPTGWFVENGVHRVFPGRESPAAVELASSNARLVMGLGVPVDGLSSVQISVAFRAKGLRGADSVIAGMFFLDEDGREIKGVGGGRPIFRWTGTSDWLTDRTVVQIPPVATRALLQFEKRNGSGTVQIDDVVVTPNPGPNPPFRPYHVTTDKAEWLPVVPSKEVASGSALDASALLDPPAGRHGFVTVKGGRLTFVQGGRARFFGVQLLPPTAFLETERADALADRLARSGVNLVRLGDLDTPLGPARSLFDDTREDTKEFDPVSLARLDHLIAVLKKRGIYVALEFQGARRFRPEDDVPSIGNLGLGGGPAALFDPKLRTATLAAAEALLRHVNPETGLALKDEPALAWITLFGEVTLFDRLDDPDILPPSLETALKARGQGRAAYRAIEAGSLKEIADGLRGFGIKIPIAGVSHWRRETDFALACAGAGLDLIDDRLFWSPSPLLAPTHRSLLWSRDGGLLSGASKKRKADRPYVVGQWCDQTLGAWALPFEGADMLLASLTAAHEDWDALVRRGVFVNPIVWGASATGTGGVEDIFPVAEAINGIPPDYALLPHAASVMLRHPEVHKAGRLTVGSIPGWEPRRGRLAIETPQTVAVAGWPGGDPVRFEGLTIEAEGEYAVIAVSAFGKEPISKAKRLLVTAVARAEPTGFAWVDEWKREVADIGRPPLLREPVRGKVSWRRAGTVRAYTLDADGRRSGPVPLSKNGDAFQLAIDPRAPGMHWELVADD